MPLMIQLTFEVHFKEMDGVALEKRLVGHQHSCLRFLHGQYLFLIRKETVSKW
uniref:Uncharacterized protein n=1 Tax=Solanum lycopersicum TaxID=4081 RepID=A0A3Q7IBJ0_SOLLC